MGFAKAAVAVERIEEARVADYLRRVLPCGAILDSVAFAAAAAVVAGAAYDVVQEAFVFDEFARQDVLFRDL